MRQEGDTIYADEGKVLVRKEDLINFGESYTLGYTYYLGFIKLEEPHWEVAEDFTDMPEEEWLQLRETSYASLVEQYIRERYTISDELALQRQRESKKQAFDEYYVFCEECKKQARLKYGIN